MRENEQPLEVAIANNTESLGQVRKFMPADSID